MSVTADNKAIYRRYLQAQAHPDRDGIRRAVDAFFAPDAAIEVVHPFNAMTGAEDYFDTFLSSLMASFDGLFRRDYIAIGGGFDGGDWVSSTGYYVGHFAKPWLGIQPIGALAYLRVGEFHRMENGRAVESYIYLDIPALMITTGQWPIAESPGRDRGYTGFLPGPATQDGLLFDEQNSTESATSFRLITEMLAGLATPDERWRPYWHDNMVWHGPAAFGAFVGIENFAAFQVTFENAFEDWAGGSKGNGRTQHFTRHGDGVYGCIGGWPSVSGIQRKPFLGQLATDKMLYMRVCDWWRREGDVFVENWVFVDIPHVLLQMGRDVFAELEADSDVPIFIENHT